MIHPTSEDAIFGKPKHKQYVGARPRVREGSVEGRDHSGSKAAGHEHKKSCTIQEVLLCMYVTILLNAYYF